VNYISFSSPVFLGAGSFPFLGAPTRTLFSAAVDATPELVGLEGTMQALLSVEYFSGLYIFTFLTIFANPCQTLKMSSSIGGFTAPSMITHFCLRTPERVSNSSDGREFTRSALFSPLLSLLVFIATFVAGQPEKKPDASKYEIIPDNESTPPTPPLKEKKWRCSTVKLGYW
jgi:ceroid-lipofuscinosis MFS transporter 7